MLLILLVANIFILGSSAAEETESSEFVYDSLTTTVWIDSGEMFYIYFDPEDLELAARPPPNLPPECIQALDMVPEWLKGNLSYKFRELSNDYQVTYANLIINSPDPRYIDEIAFVIAHSAVQNLQDDYFFPELITHNAQLIYDNDQYLNYVDIVEKGDYTTVVYRDKDNFSMELERDIYYWYIVHPKLSDELATYVNPEYNYVYDPPFDRNYGVPPPTGKFWRDWLFYEADPGYPVLKDKLSEAWTVWEAISKCNSWMSDSMSFTNDEERPIQPVRIYRKHMGRCGEYQDMRNAIARAGLIPSTCTLNSAEDHMWNEFWDGRWIHWDGTTDNPMMYENGWGKKISSVSNTRGDSYIWSVTNKYTEICDYTATVLDSSGMPADGVLVNVLTEFYYNDSLLTTTTWGTTDYTGNVIIPLGDERNYWSSAESDTLGTDPVNGVTQVITNSVAGQNYTYTFNLPMSAEQLKVTDNPPPGNPDEQYRMEIRYDVVANIAKSENSQTGEEGDIYGPSGDIDFFIADEINYNLYVGGLSFNAYDVGLKSTEGELSLIIPDNNRYYIVMSNEFSQASAKIVEITVDIVSEIEVEITTPSDNTEFSLGELVLVTGTSWGPDGVDVVECAWDMPEIWEPATDTGGGFSTWQFELDTTGTTPGMHTVWIRARIGEDTNTTSINIILNDITGPEVIIHNPIQDAAYKLGETLKINGTTSDNSAVQKLELIINNDQANSIDISFHLSDGFFTYDLSTYTLDYGDHVISVRAMDTSGNMGSDTRNIRVQEGVLPTVRIDSPDNGSLLKRGNTITITGIATDNNEIASLEIIVDGGTPVDIFSALDDEGEWSFDWDTKSKVSGEHTIEVIVIDGSDNAATDTISLNLDGSIPVVYIQVPEEGQVFSAGETITIEGTVSDDHDIGSVQLSFDQGPSVDITKKVRNGEWRYNWNTYGLDSGEHEITVMAYDSVGHMSQNALIVIIDASAPEVTFSGIEEVIEIGDWITFIGTASDDIEITELTLVIDDDNTIDITSSLSYGVWSWDVDTSKMNEGIHIITVIAKDSVGNEIEEFIQIELAEEDISTDDGLPEDIFDNGGETDKGQSDAIETEVIMLLFLIIVFIAVATVLISAIRAKKKKNHSW